MTASFVRLARVLLCVLLSGPIGPAAAETRLVLERPARYDLQSLGFELDRPAAARIEAVGLDAGRGDGPGWLHWFGDEQDLAAYGWLLDAATRRPVWILDRDGAEPEGRNLSLWKAERKLRLAPGRYELYLWSGLEPDRPEPTDASESRSLWDRLWSRDESAVDEELQRCHVTLVLEDIAPGELRRFEVSGELPSAVLRQTRLGDSQRVHAGFRLEHEMELRLYGVLEIMEDAEYAADTAWIVAAETRERVWDASQASPREAGGAAKNRRLDQKLRLGPGAYVLHVGTDDSHSFERFNAAPPYDPFNWGITLLPGAGFDAEAFTTFEPPPPPEPLVRLGPAEDSTLLEQPFRMTRAGNLWVEAVGEYGGRDEGFADSGWIVDAEGETVWQMTEANTAGVGGAGKNRGFQSLLQLEAGDYVAYYVTDGSHAYGAWNAPPPFEPQTWGLTLRPGPGFDPADLVRTTQLEVEEPPGWLVRLVRVGDDQRLRQAFTLERPTRVRVRALGEGTSGEMHDFGRIIDASGRTVWEMTFDATRHAGGARKNRECVETIELQAGSYEALYDTDGSHSFAGWNAAPPRDPPHWGMTIRVDD